MRPPEGRTLIGAEGDSALVGGVLGERSSPNR